MQRSERIETQLDIVGLDLIALAAKTLRIALFIERSHTTEELRRLERALLLAESELSLARKQDALKGEEA